MSKVQDITRPNATRRRPDAAPMPSERKPGLSTLVHRALVSFNERGQQRRVLINVLILAQALLVVASAPAYVGLDGNVDVIALAMIGLALVACLVAFVFNQFAHNPVWAAYVLVGGGVVAVLAQVFVAALAGNAQEASHASLMLVAVILEAGLLFAPEVTLITAGTAVALTIVALLLALSLGASGSRQDIYGLVVDTLGLQIVGGLIAWLVSQFIYDSALEAQRAQELQFAQARLDALAAQQAEQHQRLEAATAALQQTIGRAINGELSARANVPEGTLSVVAASLNMLLERLDALTQGEVIRERMEAAALPLIDVVGRVSEGVTPPPASLPVMTNTPLDSVSVAVSQMQASIARRLARVQELAGEIVGALAHSQNGLSTTAQTAAEALRTVGASVAAADGLLTVTQREVDLIARARRAMNGVRPGDATGLSVAEDEAREAAGLEGAPGAALAGLGPDLGVGAPGRTEVFGVTELAAAAEEARAEQAEAAAHSDGDNAHAVTAAAAGSQPTGGKRARGAKGAAASEAQPPAAPSPELLELARLLEQLQDEVAKQERSATTLAHELGIVNRNVRGVDVGVAWARQALEAVRRNAEQLHHTAGGGAPVPTAGEAAPPSHPLGPDALARVPTATRPLADGARLPVGAPPAGPISAAELFGLDESLGRDGDPVAPHAPAPDHDGAPSGTRDAAPPRGPEAAAGDSAGADEAARAETPEA
jgi:hypothetical protein